MIAADQPTIFPDNVLSAISSIEDGSMKDGAEIMTPDAINHRQSFLGQLGIDAASTAIGYATFTGDDFKRYTEARPGLLPGVDAVSTSLVGQPIMLALADCTGAIIYDPVQHVLMVSHLGRHSTEQYGAVASVEYMTSRYGSDPADLLVWLSPSPNGSDYPLWAFNNRSFTDVIVEQLRAAGVRSERIEASNVDTVTSAHYFSHSQYLKGEQAVDGRYAIVAMLK